MILPLAVSGLLLQRLDPNILRSYCAVPPSASVKWAVEHEVDFSCVSDIDHCPFYNLSSAATQLLWNRNSFFFRCSADLFYGQAKC